MALAHGWGKVSDISKFEPFVAQLGLAPAGPWAWAAALSEFLGGLLVALGLFTRPAAIAAAGVMAVAVGKVHAADPFQKKELGLLYLAVFLAIVLCGPGRISVDAKVFGGSRGASRSSSSSK